MLIVNKQIHIRHQGQDRDDDGDDDQEPIFTRSHPGSKIFNTPIPLSYTIEN